MNLPLKHCLRLAGRLPRTGGFGLGLLVFLFIVSGCRPSASSAPRLATATSYLEAPRWTSWVRMSVLRLAEPGTCPGHFDIRPSQVAELRQCRALLRFDFQKSARRQTRRDGHRPSWWRCGFLAELCRPDSYLAACRQIADPLVELGLLARTNAGPPPSDRRTTRPGWHDRPPTAWPGLDWLARPSSPARTSATSANGWA